MPREVRSPKEAPGRRSMPRAGSAAKVLESVICMRAHFKSTGNKIFGNSDETSVHQACGHFCAQKNCHFAYSTANISRADGQDCVAGARFFEEVINSILHRAAINDVLVARRADCRD